MNKFEKVSEKEWKKALEEFVLSPHLGGWPWQWEDIVLPKRATKGSAGYDIYCPARIFLKPGDTVKIPTGVKCRLDPYRFLMIVPRSSMGFKYRMQLDNSVGIIDGDYIDNPSNEGHIYIKITNDGHEGKLLDLHRGDAFAQGIILNFDVTLDNEVSGVRTGGIGSTSSDI